MWRLKPSDSELKEAAAVLESIGEDGLASLYEAMGETTTGKDYRTLYGDVFDEWCDWLEARYYEAHPRRSFMPDSFYVCQEAWAKARKEPSFATYVCGNFKEIVDRMLDVYNSKIAEGRPHSTFELVSSYVARHANRLLCMALEEAVSSAGDDGRPGECSLKDGGR